MDSIRSQAVKFRQTLSEEGHALQAVVLIWIVLKKKRVSIAHICPHCQVITCLEIRMLDVLSVAAARLQREVKHTIAVIDLTDTFVETDLARQWLSIVTLELLKEICRG